MSTRAERRGVNRRDQKAAKIQSRDEAAGVWTEWDEVHELRNAALADGPIPITQLGFDRCVRNNRYQVLIRRVGAGPGMFGPCVHLSIRRMDRAAAHDWREFQRIKNELVGPETEAVELYPRESRLVDGANQYHLWVFPQYQFPFGFANRDVRDADQAMFGAVQRPLQKAGE